MTAASESLRLPVSSKFPGALAECLSVYVAVRVLGSLVGIGPAFALTCAAFYLVAAWSSASSVGRANSPGGRDLALVGAAVFGAWILVWLLAPMRLPGWGIVPIALLVWRAWSVGRVLPGVETSIDRFQVGAVAILVLAGGASLAGLSLSDLVPALVAWFLVSFVSLAFVRTGTIVARSLARTGVALATGNLVIAVGALLALFADASAAGIREATQAAWDDWTAWASGLFATRLAGTEMVIVQGDGKGAPAGLAVRPRISRNFFGVWMFVALVVGTACSIRVLQTLVQFLIRYFRRRAGKLVALSGPRESDSNTEGGIVAFLRSWFARLAMLPGWLRLRLGSGVEPAMPWYFGALERWGRRRGIRRAASETPFEYLRRLCVAAPQFSPMLEGIVAEYVAWRYGGRPASANVERAARLWRDLARAEARSQRAKPAPGT